MLDETKQLVIRLCHHRMQEEMTDQWGRLALPRYTTALHIAHALNSQHYIADVLKSVGLLYIQRLPSAIFQQDYTRSHVARNVQEFFFTRHIDLLPWPACFPDLSPIGNVWFMLAQRLARDKPVTVAPYQLWQHVEAAWTAVPQGYIQSPFNPMPRHKAAVIDDGYTNY
ncbi:transposable element Tcb1 transposase [Trichonephila clavipes]|nr:transposable element Tcb1 transposase [Trichonephila clavipes]